KDPLARKNIRRTTRSVGIWARQGVPQGSNLNCCPEELERKAEAHLEPGLKVELELAVRRGPELAPTTSRPAPRRRSKIQSISSRFLLESVVSSRFSVCEGNLPNHSRRFLLLSSRCNPKRPSATGNRELRTSYWGTVFPKTVL